MRHTDRRQFLHETATIAAGVAALQAGTLRAGEEAAPGKETRKAGPNDTVRMAIIGVRGRGMEHIGGLLGLHDARITTICDVDRNVIGPAIKTVEKYNGSAPKYVQDLRRVFDDPDIDAVSIATPNHWHALAAIWAVQAGKDVYVEKPVSHNISEGRRIVEAARKHGKIVQTGTQCRSHAGIQSAIEFLHSGKLGKIYMAKGLCYKPRGSIGHKDGAAVPAGVDYNLWLGPAPERPFNPNRFHYNWHWFWDTGNGDLGNQGIHQMDLARWGLGKNEFPKTVMASGGRFGYSDDGQTPNTELVAFEFDDAELQFEVRGLPTNEEARVKIGDIFYGTEGILAITSYTDWYTLLGPKMEPGPRGSGGGDHFANFIQCVKARDPGRLHADIEQGHLSSAYCHLGNIAYRLGRKLHINPSSESFVNDADADAMLTREYRAPFIVPSKI
ncbi:MAG: Gfo/Idh/MocA family oxidoreductase [Isosphaeraceae bacterium]